MYGSLKDLQDGGTELRFERRYAKPVAKVWAALTTPERIADWFASAELDPRPGGRYVLRWPDFPGSEMVATVLTFEPMRIFEHTWKEKADAAESRVRWELEPDGDGCRLTLVHSFPVARDIAGFLSGWHSHLDALEGAAEGLHGQWSRSNWEKLNETYKKRLAG
jgi:uncharacterized protein YndB with AHSA1/START domain